MISLSRWGSSDPPVIKPSMSQGPNIWRVKEISRRTQKPNSKLLSPKLKTSLKILSAWRRKKEKGIMEIKKSSVHTTGRDSTLNMPTWKETWWSYLSPWEKSHQSSGKLSEGRSARSGTTAWKRSCPHGKYFEFQSALDRLWSFEPHDGWKRLLLILGDRKIHPHL